MIPNDRAVTFVIPGALHLTEAGLENHRVASWVVEEANALIRPDFVQFIGDNVRDATDDQFRLFAELAGRLEVPHHALVGDHDVTGDPGATGFLRHLGPTFGATSLKGFRFLRLDTRQASPVGLSPEQVAWFRGQVAEAVALGERIIVFQHHYPYQIWGDFAGPGIDGWREVVQTRRIVAIFAGNTHYAQAANDGRNALVATRSIARPEGGPPGYILGHAEGDDLAYTHRSIEDDGPGVLITHPREMILATGPGHVVAGPDVVRVRTWSELPIVSARARFDGERWSEIRPEGPGHWTLPIPAGATSRGVHTLGVEVVDESGRPGAARILFAADPAGRYTAVPTVSPPVDGPDFR